MPETSTQKFENLSQVEVLIRARYPLLYVVTWEEDRALNEISQVAAALGKKVYDWTIVQGITRYRNLVGTIVEGKKGTKDPIVALREVFEITEPAIFVFRDFHNFLSDPTVKRLLRDLAHALRTSLTTVILLAPVLKIPEELEKELAIVDLPLPGREEIERLLENIAADIGNNPNLSIDLSPESREAIVDAAIGLTLNEAENVFAKTLVLAKRLSAAEAPLVYSEKKQIIRKSGILEYIETAETLSSIGGLDVLKEWIVKRRKAMAPGAREFGLPSPKGVLLAGVQGCGKSLAAKAIANELKFPLLRLDVGRLFSKMVGETELNIRRAIAIAETVAPVVLWIDEIEKGLSGVKSSAASDAGTTARVFGTIITWLQEKQSPVFVVATANEIEDLPAEILRKGRFDEIFFVDLPEKEERKEIFRIHLAKRHRNPDVFDLDVLAALTEGFSGAEIEQVLVEALFDVYGVKNDIETADLIGVIKRQIPLSRTMRDSIRNRRIWAMGRTVAASSYSHLADALVKPDSVDDEKERLYLQYLKLSRDLPAEIRQKVEAFMGPFPSKDTETQRMKLYLADYQRLAKLVKQTG